MKWTATFLMCLTIWLVAGCAEGNKITAWGLSGQDADMIGRLGVMMPEMEELEAGGVIKYWSADLEGEYTPVIGGVYLIRHFTIEARIEDKPERGPLGPILEGLALRPYAGIEVVCPWKGDEHDPRWNVIAGTLFSADPDYKWAIVIEGVAGDGYISSEDDSGGPTADDWGAFLGFRYEF